MQLNMVSKVDMVVSVYVDNLLITGSRPSDIGNFRHELIVLLHIIDHGLLTDNFHIEVK